MCEYCNPIVNYDKSKLKSCTSKSNEVIAGTNDYHLTDSRVVKYSDPDIFDEDDEVLDNLVDPKFRRWQDGDVTLFIEDESGNVDIRIQFCPFCGIKF